MIAAAPPVSVAPQDSNAVNAPSSSTNLTPRVASFIGSNPSRPTRSRARRQVRPCGTRGERHDVQIPSRVPGAASRAVCRVATDRCKPAAARCLLLGRRRAPCPGRAVDAWFPLIPSVRRPTLREAKRASTLAGAGARMRGKGIASPDQPREPKQSWRPQGPTGLDVRDHDRAPSLLNPDSEQAGSRSCVGSAAVRRRRSGEREAPGSARLADWCRLPPAPVEPCTGPPAHVEWRRSRSARDESDPARSTLRSA